MGLTSHVNGLSPVWTSVWFCRWWLCVKLLLQMSQTKRLSPVWIRMWRRSDWFWNAIQRVNVDAPGMCRAALRCACARGFATGAWRWTTSCKSRTWKVCNPSVSAGGGSDRTAEMEFQLILQCPSHGLRFHYFLFSIFLTSWKLLYIFI